LNDASELAIMDESANKTSGTAATKAIAGKRAQPWYLQLWFQVLVAMAVGIALGHLYPDLGAKMQPLGDGFIKAIRVLIAPIIFCTVVHGIASMASMAKVGRVALKALIYFEVLTTIAPAMRHSAGARVSPEACRHRAGTDDAM
jgi:Na+/H+-dicarboxylate symporter